MAKEMILSAERRDGKVFAKIPKEHKDKAPSPRKSVNGLVILLIVAIGLLIGGLLLFLSVENIAFVQYCMFAVGAICLIVSIDRLLRKETVIVQTDENTDRLALWVSLSIIGVVLMALSVLMYLSILPMPVWFEASANAFYWGLIFTVVGAVVALIGILKLMPFQAKTQIKGAKAISPQAVKTKTDAQAVLNQHYFLRTLTDGRKWFSRKLDCYGYGSFTIIQCGIMCICSLFLLLVAYFYYGNSVTMMLAFLGLMLGLGIVSLSFIIPVVGSIVAFWTYFTGANAMIVFFGLPPSQLTDIIVFLMFVLTLIGNIGVTLIFTGAWALKERFPEIAELLAL